MCIRDRNCTHLAAFRTATNMRKSAIHHIVTLPLGYFSQNAVSYTHLDVYKRQVFKRIGSGQKDDCGQPYEEWFITDYDCYVDGIKYLGIDLKHIAFDVVLSAYVVNPSYITSDIKSIVERFIQTKLPYFEEIYGKKTTYVIPDEKTVATYALDKGSLVLRLKEVIDKKLKENHQIDLFYNIELPLAKILGLVEMNGFKVNENKLKEVGDYFNTFLLVPRHRPPIFGDTRDVMTEELLSDVFDVRVRIRELDFPERRYTCVAAVEPRHGGT